MSVLKVCLAELIYQVFFGLDRTPKTIDFNPIIIGSSHHSNTDPEWVLEFLEVVFSDTLVFLVVSTAGQN